MFVQERFVVYPAAATLPKPLFLVLHHVSSSSSMFVAHYSAGA